MEAIMFKRFVAAALELICAVVTFPEERVKEILEELS
jgi:hypothetical protein